MTHKKTVLLLIFLIIGFVACGQNYYRNTFTLEWDAAVAYEDATPFAPTDIVEYEVGYSIVPVADLTSPDSVTGLAGSVSIFIIVPAGSDFLRYAARTKLTTDEGQTVLYSDWEWATWQMRRPHGRKPKKPVNLRIQ